MGLWFSGRLWVPSPGSRPPTSQGRAEPWRVSTAFPVRSGPVSSQSPRLTASPRHPCSGPESPQVARGEPPRCKGPRGGKRGEGGGATPQEVSRTRAHPTSPPRAPPLAGSSRNSPPGVRLNQTMRSKSRKPRRVSGPPISPFAIWISILQEWRMAGQRSGSFLGRCRRCSARAPCPRARPVKSLTLGFPRLLAREQGVATSCLPTCWRPFVV